MKSVAIGGGAMLTAGELFGYLTQAANRGPLPARPDERWSLGICALCPAGCGLLARVRGEQVVQLRGSPFHPLNRGGLCPKGLAGAQLLYHPDRLKTPLRRAGQRGAGRFEPTTWPAALAELGRRLRDQADTVIVAGAARSQLAALRRAVLPRATFLEHRPYYDPTPDDPAFFMTQGLWGHPAYDVGHSDYVLSFDSGLLERSHHTGETLRLFGLARRKQKCRLVQVESRRSLSGARAAPWIPLRAGTEATLALGIAHVIVKEGLTNRAFVTDHTFGFEDWIDQAGQRHAGFQARVLKAFDPRAVSDVTGVPIDTIIQVARDFATARAPLALGSDLPGVQDAPTRMAIRCLNALVGSIERPGGVLAPRLPEAAIWPPTAPSRPGAATAPLAGPAGPSAEALLSKRSVKPRTLVLADVDLIADAHDGAVLEAVRQSEFVVVLSTLRSATVAQGDLVLPLPTHLEQLVDRWDHTADGYPLVSVAKAVVAPLGESRAEADIWTAIARQVGRKLPGATYEQIVEAALKKIYAAHYGQLFGLQDEEAWAQVLERSGWQPPRHSDFAGFVAGAYQVGGWWDPIYYHREWKRALKTPSGKFEFYCQSLAALAPKGAKGAGVDHAAPHQPARAAADPAYPLALQLFTPPAVGGQAGRLSFLRSIAGAYVNVNWQTWVELNPQTAKELKIAAGSGVRVRSAAGAVEVTAVYSPGTPPQTAVMPCGLLATDTDPAPSVDARVLLVKDEDHFTGERMHRATRVAIDLL